MYKQNQRKLFYILKKLIFIFFKRTENDTNIIEKEKNTKDIPIPQIQRQIFEELKKYEF